MKKGVLLKLLAIALASVIFLTGCSFGKKKIAYQDGVFSGVSANGNIHVSVTLADNKITAVDIKEYNDAGDLKDIETYQVCVPDGTAPLLAEAHPALAQRIVDKNSWDVDTFTGATNTSAGVKEAAKKALEAAAK